MEYISVAIDGPSGAGKSTVARAVAARMGYVYVDTGAMYRAIGLAVYRRESRVRIRRGSSRPCRRWIFRWLIRTVCSMCCSTERTYRSDPHAGNRAICVKGLGRAGGAAFFAGCTAGYGKKSAIS